MRTWKWRLVALVLVGGLTQTGAGRVAAQVDVPGLIDQAAGYYRMPEWARLRAHAVAWCESKYDAGAYNRRSGATGVFQFIPSTARGQGINPWDAEQNVYAAMRLMAAGQWQHWRACL